MRINIRDSEGCLFCKEPIPPRKSTGQGSKGPTKKFCCANHRAQYAHKRMHKVYREELLAAYGHKCACCGESTAEFLQLDHVNGGGNKDRALKRDFLYRRIKLEGYPKDKYRVLCANCNSSLGFYGYCPHTKEQNG